MDPQQSTSQPLVPAAQIDALTGLRFFAALAVIFVHSMNLGLRRDAGCEQWAASAVSFFFVLSGFILTYVYDCKLTWAKVPDYLIARVARIWPLHVVCLCFTAILFLRREYLPWNAETAWRFVTNLFLVQSWLPIQGWPFSFNGPAWSISTELGFYLAFPLLLLWGRRRFWPVALGVAVISLGGLVWLQSRAQTDSSFWGLASELAYCHPLIRGLDFIVGMIAGKLFLWGTSRRSGESTTQAVAGIESWWRDTLVELLALTLLAGVGYAASRSGPLHSWLIDQNWQLVDYWSLCGGALLVPFAFLIWVFAWSRGAFAQLLSQPLMVWLGEISFAFYLVQNPVIRVLDPWVERLQLPVSLVIGVVLSISLASAMLLHLIVELPCRTILREAVAGYWSRVWRAVYDVPGNLMRSGVALTAAGLIAVALAMAVYESGQQAYRTKRLYNEWSEKQSGLQYLRIGFAQEATLRSSQCAQSEETLEITLLWEVDPDSSRARFVHVTDPAGKILFQAELERAIFQQAEPGDQVTDRVLIENVKLPAEGFVGVGFYDKYKGTTSIQGQPLSMNGRRLEIIQLQGGKAVLLEH